MEPHKLDKHFRTKLNQREIKPSENAWDRLDAMLTVAEQKKPKRGYSWLFIAATIAGFLLIGTIFFGQTEKLIDKGREEVVIQNPTQRFTNSPENDEPFAPRNENDHIAEVSHPAQIKQRSSNQNHSNQNAIINQNNQNNASDAINEINKNESLIASNVNQKTEQQTASAKVDELLAAVEAQNPGKTKPSVKVNAKNLLSEVDKDVNLSFREKLMRTAHRNYQEVAEAVTTRNIQQ